MFEELRKIEDETPKEITIPAEIVLSPAKLKIQQILEQYSHNYNIEPELVRKMLVSKLIESTETPLQKERLRAIELLGKVKGVDLFEERTKETKTTIDDAELDRKIQEKLKNLQKNQNNDVIDAEVKEITKK